MQKKEYDLKSVKLPYLSGDLLKVFAALLEGPLGALILPSLLKSSGISWIRRQQIDEEPTMHPLYISAIPGTQDAIPTDQLPASNISTSKGFKFLSIFDYAQAYREGKITPEEVAEKFLAAAESSNDGDRPLRSIIEIQREDVLRQAQESSKRFKEGRPLGVLDGVPIAVKDEIDVALYKTTVGTSFLGQTPSSHDATVVARLRKAGGLVAAKTNMHEIGINVTGLNPHHGVARNPYNVEHFTGGSSSGSASAVAAGLVPLAIGADGGGSIRIPASFCGVFGLKSTHGRISEAGAAPLCWSVAHLGPLTATASDLALAYGLMAGPDIKDPNSMHQMQASLAGWDRTHLKGTKLGIYPEWFEHADSNIVSACKKMLEFFKDAGAEIHEVVIPNLELNRVAHSITIVSEMTQAMSYTYEKHHREHGLDVRINLALGRSLKAQDYILAQRARTKIIANFMQALAKVDMILTPSTAIVAPKIKQGALPLGESDLTTTMQIMRFATAANFTGLPALSFPVGYTPNGLPIGMQAMGRPWQEAELLRLALNSEPFVERQKPQVYYRYF